MKQPYRYDTDGIGDFEEVAFESLRAGASGYLFKLSNTHISGATWGLLNPQAAAGRGTYLPLIVK